MAAAAVEAAMPDMNGGASSSSSSSSMKDWPRALTLTDTSAQG